MKNFLIILLIISNVLFGYEYFQIVRDLDAALERYAELARENDRLVEKYHELRELYNMQVPYEENHLRISYRAEISSGGVILC